jgi:hypothetical protein
MCKNAFRQILVVLAIAMGGASVPAQQTSDWVGELSSSQLDPMPARPTFDVQIYDDTTQNLAFRAHFLGALRKAGYETSDKADLQFTFATSITWRISRLRELERKQLQRYPVDREEASFPFDRPEDLRNAPASQMFGDRRRIPPRIASTITNTDLDRLDISVEIRSRKSGKVVWTADLALPFLAPDRARIIASITGPIIDAIGRDIRRQRFEIR